MDLPSLLHVVGPGVLGATFGAAGWAYFLRWTRGRTEVRAGSLEAASADILSDTRLLSRPISLGLASRGWTPDDLRRLASLTAADLGPAREMELVDALYCVAFRQWPGRTRHQQIEWMLALVGTSLRPDYEDAPEVAEPFIKEFGRDLAPLACAAGVTASDGDAAGTLDRETLVMMAALRGRSGFTG